MDRINLKSCPFCGGKAKLIGFRDCVEGENRIYIQCQNCKAQTQELYAVDLFSNGITTLDPIECIIKSWNTREPIEQLLFALEHRKEFLDDMSYREIALGVQQAIDILKVWLERINKEVG